MPLLQKIIIRLTGMGLGALCAVGYADDRNIYVQLNAGAAFVPSASDTGGLPVFSKIAFAYDPGYAAGLALGFHLAGQFRLEGELMYQASQFNNQFVDAASGGNRGATYQGGVTGRGAAECLLRLQKPNGFYALYYSGRGRVPCRV